MQEGNTPRSSSETVDLAVRIKTEIKIMLHEKGADINAIYLLTWQTIHGRNAATGSTTQ